MSQAEGSGEARSEEGLPLLRPHSLLFEHRGYLPQLPRPPSPAPPAPQLPQHPQPSSPSPPDLRWKGLQSCLSQRRMEASRKDSDGP